MSLMKTVPELEEDFKEATRNMDIATVTKLQTFPTLPQEMKGVFLFERAHAIYWQIQALNDGRRFPMWHPV